MKARSGFTIYLLVITIPFCIGQRRSLTPDFFAIQYAGSIGYLSAGGGYDAFKSRGRASLHFGSVPKNQGGPLNIITGKLFYEPWHIRLSENAEINPADFGLMISYHTGDDFKMNVPDYFKSGNYYWWHTSLRVHLALETSVSINFDPSRFFKKFTGYVEFNTNDLYVVSILKNASTLKPHDLIKVGVGTRFTF